MFFYVFRFICLLGICFAAVVIVNINSLRPHFTTIPSTSSSSSNVATVRKMKGSQNSLSEVENKPVNESHDFTQQNEIYTELPPVRSGEVQHIGFLKVHKAASSTMQNIFYRFGIKRNLTFVFTEHPNYFSRNTKTHIPLVKPKYRSSYDILCNHGIFDYKIYSSVLPNDTVYLGIVRDPIEVFISAVNYYSQPEQLLPYLAAIPGNKVQNLIRFPEKYDRTLFSYTKNVMARDFGFFPTLRPDFVNKKLNELSKIFKLVLLVEYFEESLILMKRYLNWKLQDILYLSNNVYRKQGWSLRDLDQNDIEKFKQRNQLDFIVYNFFYEKFWQQFREEPKDIHLEVLNFKDILKTLYTFCNTTSEDERELLVKETDWNEEFHVSKQDCKYIKTDELEFIKILRKLQGSELPVRVKRKKRVLVRRPIG